MKVQELFESKETKVIFDNHKKWWTYGYHLLSLGYNGDEFTLDKEVIGKWTGKSGWFKALTDDQLFNIISRKMTTKVTKSDIPELRFYKHSSAKIVVYLEDTSMPLVVLPGVFADQLINLGVKKVKKPAVHKSTPPLYD